MLDQDYRPRVIYLSHGGGPLPLLGDAGHAEMVAGLQTIAAAIDRPAAMVVISAHWESTHPAITGSARPGLLYDYRGFPDEAYQIAYPVAGAPDLAEELAAVLAAAGFAAEVNTDRGLDHGVFVPLKIIYPRADIPCVQLSLLASLDPVAHIQLGAAMSALRRRGLLVIGSGFSFHNLPAFFRAETAQQRQRNLAFDAWLAATVGDPDLDEHQRRQRLVAWQLAPHARYCHPREEHLLPLHVCYGLAGRACGSIYRMTIMGKAASAFLW